MISVALCTYNGSKYLREQLDSLATQTLLPAELQVGDDRSTDDTLDILEEFRSRAPFPVHVTVNQANLGFGENFIQTAKRCSSTWIAFCDQDDLWHPDKLKRCAQLIEIGPSDTRLVVHNARLAGDTSGLLDSCDDVGVHRRLTLHPVTMWAGFRQVFHRDLLVRSDWRCMPWREERYSDAHDAWIPLLAGATGSFIVTGEPLVDYRRHEGNITALQGEELPPLSPGSAFTQVAEIMDREGLVEQAAYFRAVARRHDLRRNLRSSPKFPARLRAFRELLLSGAYRAGGYERFGKRALIDDLRALVTR
jgi:glycosyltransferase involved in cell wall biosynthesis